MAVTQPIRVTYTIADAQVPVQYSNISFNLPVTGLTGGQREEFALAFAQVLDDIIDGAIVKISLTTLLDLPAGIKGAGDPGADVEEGAEFSWTTAVGYPSTNRVPTFKESQFSEAGDSKQVNQANTEVAAFINAVLLGLAVTGGQAQPCDSHNVDLTVLRGARSMFQKERR